MRKLLLKGSNKTKKLPFGTTPLALVIVVPDPMNPPKVSTQFEKGSATGYNPFP